jgi:hypothetical protein
MVLLSVKPEETIEQLTPDAKYIAASFRVNDPGQKKGPVQGPFFGAS